MRLDETQKVSAEAAAVLELYRSQFFAAHRSGLVACGAPDAPERESHRRTVLSMSVTRVPPAMAAETQERLQQVASDLTDAEAKAEADGAETVTVNVLVGYFSSDTGN